MNEPIKGALYRHKKGGLYRVDGIAKHTDRDGVLVIYHSVVGGVLWARPIEEFMDGRFALTEEEKP